MSKKGRASISRSGGFSNDESNRAFLTKKHRPFKVKTRDRNIGVVSQNFETTHVSQPMAFNRKVHSAYPFDTWFLLARKNGRNLHPYAQFVLIGV